jgi:hypothetical protein
VFLLLLCNDRAVLGPWVNSARLNIFTSSIIAILVMLSMILTLSVLFPGIDETTMLGILIGGSGLAIIVTIAIKLARWKSGGADAEDADAALYEHGKYRRDLWRMPPLDRLPPARLTTLNRVWLVVLRAYLVVAAGLVLIRIVTLAIGS